MRPVLHQPQHALQRRIAALLLIFLQRLDDGRARALRQRGTNGEGGRPAAAAAAARDSGAGEGCSALDPSRRCSIARICIAHLLGAALAGDGHSRRRPGALRGPAPCSDEYWQVTGSFDDASRRRALPRRKLAITSSKTRLLHTGEQQG